MKQEFLPVATDCRKGVNLIVLPLDRPFAALSAPAIRWAFKGDSLARQNSRDRSLEGGCFRLLVGRGCCRLQYGESRLPSRLSLVAEALSWLLWVVSVLVRKVTETTEASKRRMQSIYGPKS